MEKLAAMHPAFLRFPGGNYLEGDHIAERFDWKKTIGPLDRPPHPPQPLELPLLRRHGSARIPRLVRRPAHAARARRLRRLLSAAGACRTPAPISKPYVQDALDEIEYVTGSTDTKWGAERAKDGHPAPFTLTYVEIGNED